MVALLRAIAERLIPGIPEETRISILQQTNGGAVSTNVIAQAGGETSGEGSLRGPTVLEEVVDKATARSELEQEINGESVTNSAPVPDTHSLNWRCQSCQAGSAPTMATPPYTPCANSVTRGYRRSSSCSISTPD